MADIDVYAKDGTTTLEGKPADKSKTGTWKACPYILGNEFCERLAFYGMSTNLVNYLMTRLNMDNATAVTNNANWSGTVYITPLIGGFVADAYLGKFWTIFVFSITYFLGMLLLTLSTWIPGLKPFCNDKGVCNPSMAQSSTFFTALYVIALGAGGIKACVSSFGADQFDDTDEKEKEKKVSYFNWFYFSINVGALIASSVLVWVQTNVGWGLGFGIPTIAMLIAIVSFFSGSNRFRIQKPGGSPLTRMLQVIVASFRNRGLKLPADYSCLLYETSEDEVVIAGSRNLGHTQGLSCLDRAAVLLEEQGDKQVPEVRQPWRLCTVTQVEELKAVVRMLPIWATGIIFSAVYSQMSGFFVIQGNTMDPHFIWKSFKVPSATLSVADTISVLIWVVIYDKLIVELARRKTGHKNGFTHLQRMGIGLFVSILAMLVAGGLESYRLHTVRVHNYYDLKYTPMSIFWLIIPYFLIGSAEVFTFVGQLEYYYDQAPDSMRSMCAALSLTTNALGNYVSSLLVTIITKITTKNGSLGWIPDNLNRGHLDYFYYVLAGLSFINLVVYLFISKRYTYKEARGTVKVI